MNTMMNGKEWSGVYVDGKDVSGMVKNGQIFFKQIIDNNLLKLLKENTEYVAFDGNEVSVTFNENNTITINASGIGDWGLNISQPNLMLEAGKTYKLSCNNIYGGTWISINNENDKMINRDTPTIEFTPAENITNPKVVIWVNSGVVYNNVTWDIKLIEI